MTRNSCTCDLPAPIRCPECQDLVLIDSQNEMVTHRKVHKIPSPDGRGNLIIYLPCPASGAAVKREI